MILGAEPKNQVIWIIRFKVMAPNMSGLLAPVRHFILSWGEITINFRILKTLSTIGRFRRIYMGFWPHVQADSDVASFEFCTPWNSMGNAAMTTLF